MPTWNRFVGNRAYNTTFSCPSYLMHLQIQDNYDELFKWKTFDRLAFKWNLLRTPKKNNHVANKRLS
jgi:hypothetical protein